MNLLVVGRNTTDTILDHLSGTFLLIDDGPIIDEFIRRTRRKYTELDFMKDSFNPLAQMDSRKARDFISILDSIFPEGESTLTKKNSNHLILKTLVTKEHRPPRSLPKLLDRLTPAKGDAVATDAFQKIENLLLSDVLEDVLCPPQTFTIRGVLLARLNRAELGDFVCFAIANFLIGQYKGQVVIPDFVFYGSPFHRSLIRQQRLIAGVSSLEDTPFKRDLLLIKDKVGSGAIFDDAEILADYSGRERGTTGYSDFVKEAME